MNSNKCYIKFYNPEDVHLIIPYYVGDIVCNTCGECLYIPVALPENAVVYKPYSTHYQPFPIEYPELIIRSAPEPVTVEFDDNSVIIKAYSTKPVQHICSKGIKQ